MSKVNTLRQCNQMYMVLDGEKVRLFCEKKNKKSTLNKCMKCILKSEGLKM